MATVPLIIYLGENPQAGDTLYSYNSGVSFKATGFSILNQAGVSVEIDVYKNGTLIDQIMATGTNYTTPNNFLPYYFDAGDILDLRVPTNPGSPLNGLTVVFYCEVSAPVDTSATTQSNQIQTPLVARFESDLVQNNSFFYFVPSQRIHLFGYTLSLRNTADQNVLINVKKGGNTVTQLLLSSGDTVEAGLIDAYFEVGEVLTFQIAQCGTNAAPGQSLLVLLDYRNTTQTEFGSFQTPFVIQYEGLSSSTSNSILYYTCPRDMTLANLQLFTKNAFAQNVTVGVYKNGQIVANFSLTAGNVQTQPTLVNLSFVEGDLLQAVLTSPASLSHSVLLTIDYSIKVSDSSDDFNYYSDPSSDIVILARQVGFGGAKADAISFKNLLKYQKDVDNILNGRLRALYRTPLSKVSSGNNPWPGAIQIIAQRMVLRYLLNDVFTEVEPNASQDIQNQAQMANEDLQMLLNKETLLEGQRLRSRNYGSSAYTEPLTPPQPAVPPIIQPQP